MNKTLTDATDSHFDQALRQALQASSEPDDGGFTQRVLHALPARQPQHASHWLSWAAPAQLTALSAAGCALAAMGVSSDASHQIASSVLIGLLVLWSVPSRLSRL
jgi:hypothetical protein